MENASLLKRWMALAMTLFCVWALVFVACPAMREASPSIKRMANFVDFSGIETGEFYYTDVEIVGHADHNARATIRFTPQGPGPVDGDS